MQVRSEHGFYPQPLLRSGTRYVLGGKDLVWWCGVNRTSLVEIVINPEPMVMSVRRYESVHRQETSHELMSHYTEEMPTSC